MMAYTEKFHEPLVAYQLNWKGENFYTGNRVALFIHSEAPFIRYMNSRKGAGVHEVFVALNVIDSIHFGRRVPASGRSNGSPMPKSPIDLGLPLFDSFHHSAHEGWTCLFAFAYSLTMQNPEKKKPAFALTAVAAQAFGFANLFNLTFKAGILGGGAALPKSN